jgi:hypothetical protein
MRFMAAFTTLFTDDTRVRIENLTRILKDRRSIRKQIAAGA